MTRSERIEKLMKLIKRGLDTGKIKDVSLIQGDRIYSLKTMVDVALKEDGK